MPIQPRSPHCPRGATKKKSPRTREKLLRLAGSARAHINEATHVRIWPFHCYTIVSPATIEGRHDKELEMLNWALAFFVIAILAAIFGFTGIAAASAGLAKILFFVFLLVFLVTLVMGVARRA